MKPKFLVSIPTNWIEMKHHPIKHIDTKELIDNILQVLTELNYEYETTETIKKKIKFNGIHINHHTMIKDKNVWNTKKSYIPGYAYFDRTGYSGWAEMADSQTLFDESQRVDEKEAIKFFDEFTSNYINTNHSKVPQPDEEFELDEPYIFVAGQRPGDTVAQLAKVNTGDLVHEAIRRFKGTKYKVVVKLHPFEYRRDLWVAKYKEIFKEDNVIVTSASIHSLIKNAAAVYTVNSGVGFESLFHLKQVFTSGHCDYHWVTNVITSPEDITNTMDKIEQPVDEIKIKKFIYYIMNEYFVKTDDIDKVRKRVKTAIDEYEI